MASREVCLGALRNSLYQSLGLISLSILVMVGLAVFYAYRFVAPILALTRSISDLGEENLKVRFDTDRNDEIGVLTNAFNRMSEKLTRAFEELRSREKELNRTNDRLQDYMQTASDWVWESDADHRIIVLGKSDQDSEEGLPSIAKGRTRIEVTNENVDSEKWRRHATVLDAHEGFSDFRYSMLDRDGKEHIISTSGKPVFDAAGDFVGYRGTSRDVTEQENLQQNLKDAEARLQSAFQNVTVGIVVADARGKIILCNAKILEFFGYSEDELVGRNVSVLANGRDAERHDQYLEAFASTGVAKIIGSGREVVGRHKDGREFPVSLGIAEMSLDGEVQYIASLVDLTEQKALSQQLRQSQKMEAIGQLVGGIAHDFNNLLGIIMGNLDLMQRQVDPESRLSRQLEKALGATERAANLTARLLGFSRQTPTSREPVDVQETIANLIELLQKSVTEQVKITLAPTSCSCFASADKGDLEDAVTNLCINARDAMPGGGSIYIETRRVAISEQDHHLFKDLVTGDYVEISVTDDGQGIPVEIIDHIFDPFFSTKEKGKGTGLGLSMVYGFAKRSGGAVSCYSEEGIGTTFKIYLPCVEAAAIMPAGPSDRAMLEEPVRGEGAILVVDDEPDIQDIAENILTGAGYTVLRANTGKEAMDVLAERAPEISLVVSDVIMPGGVSGHDLADKVAQSYPSIKVCLASGFTGSLPSHQVGNEAVPLLKKPYSNVELTKFVAMVLNKEPH